MAVKTNAQLAAFFETGDQPSQTEFGHLIDTLQPAHVLLANDDTILTAADHAFRLLIMPNISAARKLTLPTPVLDTWFHIVSLPLAADGHTLTIEGRDNTDYFYGGVMNHDMDQTSQTTAAVFGDGTSEDVFTLPTSYGMDLWLHAKTTNVWYIWGWTASLTSSTIANG